MACLSVLFWRPVLASFCPFLAMRLPVVSVLCVLSPFRERTQDGTEDGGRYGGRATQTTNPLARQ